VLAFCEAEILVVLDHLKVSEPSEQAEEGAPEDQGDDEGPGPLAARPAGLHVGALIAG
jgi:hypothetical protein